MSPVPISSFNQESFQIASPSVWPWTDSDRANSTVGGFAFVGLPDLETTDSLVQIKFLDASPPPAKKLTGLIFFLAAFNDLGVTTVCEYSAVLTFDWNPGAGTAVPFGTVKTGSFSFDDGGGNYAVIGGDRDLWGVSPGTLEYEMMRNGEFGVIFNLLNTAGVGTFTIYIPANESYLYFEDADSTFRNRGGNRDRLPWGVR